MNPDIERFYNKLEKPQQEVFLFLNPFIKQIHPDINLQYKWGLPYFYYKTKPLVYFWVDKNTKQPYLGFAKGKQLNHPKLITGNRTVIKILPLNSSEDIPVDDIKQIILKALPLYAS